MKTNNKKNAVLLALALLFAAPGLAAYLFFQHPQWLGSSTTNKGRLITPPLHLTLLGKEQNKWRLVLWNPQNCRTDCLKQVDKLARIRLALGRRLYNVEQWLLLGDKAHAFPQTLIAALQEQDIQFMQTNAATQLGSAAQVYIISPENYVVLAYPLATKSANIFHDLKQLVTAMDKKSS